MWPYGEGNCDADDARGRAVLSCGDILFVVRCPGRSVAGTFDVAIVGNGFVTCEGETYWEAFACALLLSPDTRALGRGCRRGSCSSIRDKANSECLADVSEDDL